MDSRNYQEEYDMTRLQELDDRFSVDQMINASDLQTLSASQIMERLTRHHKVLLTRYQKPMGVMLDYETFQILLQRWNELETLIEEAQTKQLIDDRVSQNAPDNQWVDDDEFRQEFNRQAKQRFGDTDGAGV